MRSFAMSARRMAWLSMLLFFAALNIGMLEIAYRQIARRSRTAE